MSRGGLGLASVIGVDGCRGGWVAVRLDSAGFASAETFANFDEVLASHDETSVVAVDIPIGSVATGRDADSSARGFLGGRAASSVFPAPPRELLGAENYEAALRLAAELGLQGISRQSFALGTKILEVDRQLANRRVFEVHPEVSFRAMAQHPLRYRKKTWDGLFERLDLLTGEGILIPKHLRLAHDCAPDDVADAAAAAWSGRRIAAGEASMLPEKPTQRDGERLLAIWY